MSEKRCPRCKEIKTTSEFGKDRRNKDGLNIYCRSCKKQYNDEQKEYRTKYYETYHKEHRLEEQEYSKNYRKEHPESCRINSANWRTKLSTTENTLTTAEIEEALVFFNHECAYSGVPLSCGYDIDHITPVSKGGSNSRYNIVPCLSVINKQKSAKDFETWYPKQSFYSEIRYEKIKEWMRKREE